MKKRILSILVTAVAFFAVTPLTVKAEPTDLKPLMRQNFQAMFELQRLAADPKKFADPRNAKVIRERVEQLAGISHILPQVMGQGRPGQAAIAGVLSQYLSDLKTHLDRGNPEYLRNRVRTATSFCFECHTSLANQKSVKDLEKRLDGADFPPAAKAEFYAATRQFDQAVQAYDELLSRGGKGIGSEDIPETVRNALSVSVRAKRDPKLTMDYLDKAEDLKDATPAFHSLAASW